MLSYHEYEKTVFDWLMAKRKQDKNFTFSLRKKISQGQENDIFIGTQQSNYFATTFWNLRVSYPGSSGEATGVIFKLGKNGYSYYIELNQTNKPQDEQNKAVLRALKSVFADLPKDLKYSGTTTDANAMFNIKIAPLEENYTDLKLMFLDVDKQLSIVTPLIDRALNVEKLANPKFIGQRITNDEFELSVKKLEKRLSKKEDSFDSILNQLGTEVTRLYFKILKQLITDLGVNTSSEKIYFNYEKNKLIFGIGQRYVLNVEQGKYFRMISKNDIESGAEQFKNVPQAYLNNFNLNQNIEIHYNEMLLAAKETLAATNKSGHYKSDKKDFRKMAFQLTPDTPSIDKTEINVPLNQILYGPPGTGKTYHTINKALSIVENKSEDDLALESREDLKIRYKDYVANGQIVFTTFHQSMSYEDFVEGIKPEIEEDKEGIRSVVYDVRDGIFKTLCAKAKVSVVKEEKQVVYEFDDAWNDLLAEVRATEDAMDDFILDILTPKKGLKVTEITDQGNLRLTPNNVAGLEYTVSYTRTKKLQAAFPDLSVVKNIDKEFRAVIGGSNSTAYWAVINDLNKKIAKNQVVEEISSTTLKLHVLIIDEINRGNVSAIFGELITLIEESKRAGASEALELTLPYSKEKFSVPNNLYIIGTMNTADRSVEALDTALRRRFAFEEMMPVPSRITSDGALKESHGVLDGIDLAAVLKMINERIAILLDVDHQIGHSYLINVSDTNGLANAFNNCIMPLLKEYFYHDDEKIALVLGAGFVRLKEQSTNMQALFPIMSGLEVHSIDSKQQFELKPINHDTIITSLQTLLNGG